GSPFGEVFAAAVGDADGDGSPDIVAAGSFVTILSNDGTGHFGAPRILAPTSGIAVTLADVDLDGITDIVVGEGSLGTSGLGGYVAVLCGEGNGDYRAPIENYVGYAPSHLVVADFDGDGMVDAAAVRDGLNGAPYVAILHGEGSGVFAPAMEYYAGYGAQSLA